MRTICIVIPANAQGWKSFSSASALGAAGLSSGPAAGADARSGGVHTRTCGRSLRPDGRVNDRPQNA